MLKRLRSECIIELDLVTEGPLLIKSGRTFATGVDMTAVRTLRNNRWEVYIPGSSLKGSMRAQAERIARTLASSGSPGCCDPFRDIRDGHRRQDGASCSSFLQELRDKDGLVALPSPEVYRRSCPICQLFGSLSQAGRLAFDDAHTERALPTLQVRSNVGINRRTGGAAGGALFEMEVVPPMTKFHTSLYLRNFELWQLGLLAFVLRDFEEGIIKMGLAKSRGLGRIKAQATGVEIRYLGLHPPPAQGSPCVLRGMKNLEPETDYGFAAYGHSEEDRAAAKREAQGMPLDDRGISGAGVLTESDGLGLRTIYRFATPVQRQGLWAQVAPLWIAYARNHPFSVEN